MELVTIDFQGVEIPCPFADGDRMVPVRHICEAIDVQYKNQDTWLKQHAFFTRVYLLVGTHDAQNRVQDMRCLPLNLVVAWLASISDSNRRAGSVEKQHELMSLLLDKMKETYQLVEVVAKSNNYQLELIRKKEELLEQLERDKANLATTKKQLGEINHSIDEVLSGQARGVIELPFEQMEELNEEYRQALRDSK